MKRKKDGLKYLKAFHKKVQVPSPSWVKKIVPLTPSLLFKTATPLAIVLYILCDL